MVAVVVDDGDGEDNSRLVVAVVLPGCDVK